jgi:hypothetical protein
MPDHGLDEPSKRVIEQLNTKTVGPPLASTGLVGDQSPASVIEVGDIDQVRNQINISEPNVKALNMMNTLAQVSNMQSSSGPIVGTMAIKTSTSTGSGILHTIFRPDPGEIWQLVDASFDLNNATGSVNLRLYLSDGTDSVVIDHESESASGEFTTDTIGPILFNYDVYLQGWQQGTFDGVTWKAAVVRVG